jgi:hypothetical protein
MAQKTEGATQTRIFRMKAGTAVPKKFDGAEIRIRLAGDTEDAQQALANMLSLTGGNVQAVVDQFNSAAALTQQKEIKDACVGDGATVESLQEHADGITIEPNKRGRGGAKKAAVKAKAAKFDEVESKAAAVREELEALRESDPEQYEAQKAMMEKLGLL